VLGYLEVPITCPKVINRNAPAAARAGTGKGMTRPSRAKPGTGGRPGNNRRPAAARTGRLGRVLFFGSSADSAAGRPQAATGRLPRRQLSPAFLPLSSPSRW
jgi:hypothetical protein